MTTKANFDTRLPFLLKVTAAFLVACGIGWVIWGRPDRDRTREKHSITRATKSTLQPSKALDDPRPSNCSGANKQANAKENAAPQRIQEFFFDGKRTGPLPYYLVSSNGRITTAAMEAISMTESEKRSVQLSIDSFNKAAEEDAISRLVKDESASDPNNGQFVFHISASPDRGERFLLDLRSALERDLGKERGLKLCAAFNPGYGPINLSAVDTSLQVVVPPTGDNSETLIHYEMTNPATGKQIEKGYCSTEPFMRQFGNIIDFGDSQSPRAKKLQQ